MNLERKNIVFDFGNVLVRWERETLFEGYFKTEEEKRFFLDVVVGPEWNKEFDRGRPVELLLKEIATKHPDYLAAATKYINEWQKMVPGEVPGMRELVVSLKNDGYHRVFGLSNYSPFTFSETRKRLPVLQLIDDYVISGECGFVKPEISIYLYFLRKFGLKSETCVFIDDSPANLDIAQRLGMDTILFNKDKFFKEIVTTKNND